MCLKIFHLFTFSNWDAFNRACQMVEEKYGNMPIRGYFCFITGYDDESVKAERDTFSFDTLVELGQDGKFQVNEMPYSSWDEYSRNCKFLKDKKLHDVFGVIQIEMR